jgi:phenylalanyl-tRNA synthetase beta subunit
LKECKINESSAVVSISLFINELVQSASRISQGAVHYETLQDQIVWRDLCFVIDEHSSFDAVLDAVQKVKEIASLQVFDVYKGTNLPAGKKSVALKIKIVGASDAAMTTEQINDIMNKAIKAAEKAGGALRS